MGTDCGWQDRRHPNSSHMRRGLPWHSPAGCDDRAVVDQYLRSRSNASFCGLYERHAGAMYALALRMLGGRSTDAEDAVQEAWLRALANLTSFRWQSSLRTW